MSNTNEGPEELTVLDERYLSLGLASLCAWLVPHVAIVLANYRYNLAKSETLFWQETKAKGLDVIANAALVTIVVAGMVWVASAVGVAMS